MKDTKKVGQDIYEVKELLKLITQLSLFFEQKIQPK